MRLIIYQMEHVNYVIVHVKLAQLITFVLHVQLISTLFKDNVYYNVRLDIMVQNRQMIII